jgi:hypothetical protein
MKWACLFLALTLGVGSGGLKSLELPGLSGETIRPADAGDGPFAAIVFVTTDCPIANAFQPELRRLEARARELGGQFTLVHVVPDLTEEAARNHGREFAISAPVVIDREHTLVKATGAEMTPEAVLVNQAGEIVYRGRISNLFVTFGKRRSEATEHDLRDAMEAVSAGQPVKQARTEALGCYIPAP